MVNTTTVRTIAGCWALTSAFPILLLGGCSNVDNVGSERKKTMPPPGAAGTDSTAAHGEPAGESAPPPESSTEGSSYGDVADLPWGDPADLPYGDPADPGAGTDGTEVPTTVSSDSAYPGLPPDADKIGGIEFFHRIAGVWTGINQASRPAPFQFPMTVDFRVTGDSFIYGDYVVDAQNDVLWGFNIETYDGKDVLAYRNGGFLLGVLRDSRTQLVEWDTEKGYYKFCATKEHGRPVDGCNYIDAQYTFHSEDRMTFKVTTRGGRPHIEWDARRVEQRPLPDPFPASIASQGDGSAPWQRPE